MHHSILSLPSELKYHIAWLSTRSSLPSLARTHTAIQKEAERALYRHLLILTCDNHSLRCLEVLATNSDKARLVRSLYTDCGRETYCGREAYSRSINDKALSNLFKALLNMPSLSDFRLRMLDDEVDPFIWGLNMILSEDHFRLRTLYCNHQLDFPRILKTQTDLQILGIFGDAYTENILKALRQFQNTQLFLPMVFILVPDIHYPRPDQITIFPAFYSVNRSITMHQVLTDSLDKDHGSDMHVNANIVTDLSIYLADSSDMPSLHALAKNMAITFPRIIWLNILFEHECEIPAHEMKQVISLFSELYEVDFSLWPMSDRTDLKQNIPERWRAHLEEWGAECPKLHIVGFVDHSRFRKFDRGTEHEKWIPCEAAYY